MYDSYSYRYTIILGANFVCDTDDVRDSGATVQAMLMTHLASVLWARCWNINACWYNDTRAPTQRKRLNGDPNFGSAVKCTPNYNYKCKSYGVWILVAKSRPYGFKDRFGWNLECIIVNIKIIGNGVRKLPREKSRGRRLEIYTLRLLLTKSTVMDYIVWYIWRARFLRVI